MDSAQGDNSAVQKPADNSLPDNQTQTITSDTNVTPHSQIQKLEDKIKSVNLPEELNGNVMSMVGRLRLIEKENNFFAEYDTLSRYINWVVALPWKSTSQDVLDLNHASQVFNKNHYGLTEVKEKVLEYLSIMILTRSRLDKDAIIHAPILSLVGLVGTGKTTIAKSIAEALGRKFVRIPFGGMGGASQLRGKSRMMPDSEPGLVIKALRQAGTNNPVILLDEIDRVSNEARADIMGVLIELLDPEQNSRFSDHFIDYPFDLSNVLFVATSNNTKDISTAVVDRMQIIQMPSYSDDEKIYIAKNYIFPEVLRESGLKPEEIAISDDVWPEIVRPLGYDSGVRSLKRAVQGLVRKVVHYLLTGKIPQGKQFMITNQNLQDFVSQW
jgi:ATP-dependent Lon protease